MRSRALVSLPLVLLAAGCPSRDISSLGHGDNGEILADVTTTTNRDVDILFLIDNSSSMNTKQDLVASNFPEFIKVLKSLPGGLPNVHIAVASSTVGLGNNNMGVPNIEFECGMNTVDGVLQDNGLLQNTARATNVSRCADPNSPETTSCPVPNASARYIEDIAQSDGSRSRNYPSDAALEDVFTCIARLGVCGCGYEQHLEGMKRALDGSRPENAGFLRPDAYLAVVILGDEDDCSAKPDGDEVFDPVGPTDLLGPKGSFRCTEFGIQCAQGNLSHTVPGHYDMCVPRTNSYLQDPKYYADWLKKLKPDPSAIVVAAISGNAMPVDTEFRTDAAGTQYVALKESCDFKIDGVNVHADPGVRMAAFVGEFNKAPLANGKVETICQDNYSDALNEIGKLIIQHLGLPCVTGAIDTADLRPDEPGLQLNCEVSDAPTATSTATEQVIARCPMKDATTPDTSTAPCWWAAVDVAACPSTISVTNIKIVVERNNAGPPIGTHVVARCATL
jgi:hypothetical protein